MVHGRVTDVLLSEDDIRALILNNEKLYEYWNKRCSVFNTEEEKKKLLEDSIRLVIESMMDLPEWYINEYGKIDSID